MTEQRAAAGASRWGAALLVVGVLVGAAALGAVLAVVKGNGDGLGYYVGNLSAPYLLASFLVGGLVRRRWVAALAGVAAAWATLAGFYLGAELVFGYLSSAMARFYLEWFAAGVLSGLVLGLAGHAARTRPAVRLLLPLALLLEPLAVSAVRLTGRFGGVQLTPLQLTAWAIEAALGAAVLLLTARALRRRRAAGRG